MNVTVTDLAPCRKQVRIQLDEAEVAKAFEEKESHFLTHAEVPGFRKGKAPKDMVLRAFEKNIRDETKSKLVAESYRRAIQEQRLNVHCLLNVEDVQFGRGQPMEFVATLEVTPQFELPDYRGLRVKRENRLVSEADLHHALELLRREKAAFHKADHEVREGDFAVVNYTGACEGQPLEQVAPASRGLASQKNFWIEAKEGAFIPGFARQLLGARAGEKRAVTVDFPADFVSQPLAGKRGVYEVEIVEVKERMLPPLDDAFAKLYEAQNLEALREGVRQDLQNELNTKQARSIRSQVVQALLNSVDFDLPESTILAETRNVVYEIVRDNTRRGATKEDIEKSKDDIYAVANLAARERVKAAFLFARIAEKEGIKVFQHEFNARLLALAQSAQMAPNKFLKELEKREALSTVTVEVLNQKVIDFLQQNARIEDVEPGQMPG